MWMWTATRCFSFWLEYFPQSLRSLHYHDYHNTIQTSPELLAHWPLYSSSHRKALVASPEVEDGPALRWEDEYIIVYDDCLLFGSHIKTIRITVRVTYS